MTPLSCPAPRGASASSRAPGPARVAALLGAGALAGLFLAACGGDGESPAPPAAAATRVPTSAAASTTALEAFAISLARTEDTEPLLLDDITTLPASDTEEPIALP
jgi:hypothetical protein